MVTLRVKATRDYNVREQIIQAVKLTTNYGDVQTGMRQGRYVLVTVRDRDTVDLAALRKAGFEAEVL